MTFQLKMKIIVNSICFSQKHCEIILHTMLFSMTFLLSHIQFSSWEPGAVYEISLLMKNFLTLSFSSSDMEQLMDFRNAFSTTNPTSQASPCITFFFLFKKSCNESLDCANALPNVCQDLHGFGIGVELLGACSTGALSGPYLALESNFHFFICPILGVRAIWEQSN